jgi:MFS family permease
VVGLVIGIQSLATLLTRHRAGRITDTRGAKLSVAYGTVVIVAASIFYVIAVMLSSSVMASVVAVIIARILLGASESLQITGALSWGIGRAGRQRSGRVMAWNGIAMYGGLAAGAPVGILLQQHFGALVSFASIIALSVVGWIAVANLQAPPLHNTENQRSSFGKVIGQIAKYGLGLSFSAIAFGCIASFITLLFAEKGWPNASLAFILFGSSYIGVRIFFASFTDKYGGNKIAFVSLIVEAVGQLLLWHAPSPEVALAGAFITGIGFSLIFPAFGVEAVQHIAPQMRGTALGAYVAFFDVALAVTSPLAGIIAGSFGYQNVFSFGFLGAVIAIVIAFASLVSQKEKRIETEMR